MPFVPRSMDAAQPARAARQVEAQRQAMQVMKGAQGQLAHGVLADAGEQHVAQLLEAGIEDVAQHIGDDQDDGHGEAQHHAAIGIGAVEAVDDALVGEGDQRGGDLAQQQCADGQDHAEAQIGAVGGPHIGPQVADRGEYGALVRANGRLLPGAVR